MEIGETMNTQKWQHNPKWNGKISWINSSFITITPALLIGLMPWVILNHGIHWSDFFVFSVMIFLAGIALTVGYHRYFSHQSFDCHPMVKLYFLLFGAACVENSAIKWSSDHRYHHRFEDKEGDPYNINRGFFYAHMGWIFLGDPEGRSYDNAKDLINDPMVKWQHDNYVVLAGFFGFVLPALIGWCFGHPWTGMFWGGLFRVVFTHHASFLTNSACHMFGTRPYSDKVTARDSWLLAFVTNGEGFHNFHHAFGNDYRNGVKWYQWDPSKWFILSLNKLGLAWNLTRTPEAQILKAQLETSYEEFKFSWKRPEMPAQLEAMRLTLEARLQELQLKFREFQAWKESRAVESARGRKIRARYWKRRLSAESRALESALSEYQAMARLVLSGAIQS